MEDLIKALQLLSKYEQPKRPTNCEHDKLHVAVDHTRFSPDELKELGELGFYPDTEYDYGFYSYRFGSY